MSDADIKPTTSQSGLGLSHLRQPVDENYIAWLPKPSKQQTEEVKADYTRGSRCKICGTWHHPQVVHLAYVGHAATTARLLEADEAWNWEPLALDAAGLPMFDKSGGLWIKMTVAGVTRIGYGHADTKANADAGAREKEVIGDAIRNTAMRFGWALNLWHKGGPLFERARDDDDDDGDDDGSSPPPPPPAPPASPARKSAAPPPAKQAPAPSPDGAVTVDRIKPGQVKFLEGKVRALKLTTAQVKKLLATVGAAALDTEISPDQFAAFQVELKRLQDA